MKCGQPSRREAGSSGRSARSWTKRISWK